MVTVQFSLATLNKSLRTFPETSLPLIQAFNWSKKNFNEIHISPKGWTGRFTLCPVIFYRKFLDYRNNSDVRLDSDGFSGLALAIIVTMAIDAAELGDSKLEPSKVLIVACFAVCYIPISGPFV